VRVWDHGGGAVPAVTDDLGGAVREGDQRVRSGHEHVQRGVLRGGVHLVWVAQVVDRVHERLAQCVEGVDDPLQGLGRGLVEAEVQVVHVEAVGVVPDPGLVEHHERPPRGPWHGVLGRGVRQPEHAVVLGRVAQVLHVRVTVG